MNIYEWLDAFIRHLIQEEKSGATIEKYSRDARAFCAWLGAEPLSKQAVMAYKGQLTHSYAPASVNSMLVAVNAFLCFAGRADCRVKLVKVQRQIFCREERELTAQEYRRLLAAAGRSRIGLVLQTICETGLRVSELQHITVEAVRRGKALVDCKNKTRVIFLPMPLRRMLEEYIKKSGLLAGSVFVTRGGKPLDRSNIWREMKALCAKAGVGEEKVFPHNLRHLFARMFYSIDRDIVRLADLLGHSSINTTRIYTSESGSHHMSCLERLHERLTT